MKYTDAEKQAALNEKCIDCNLYDTCKDVGLMTSWRRDTQDGIHFTCKLFTKGNCEEI